MAAQTGIEVNVVDWDGSGQEVAIHFKDLGQLLTLNAEGARSLAFLLMECADFIEPPFKTDPESAESSESFFGPYTEPIEDEDADDE